MGLRFRLLPRPLSRNTRITSKKFPLSFLMSGSSFSDLFSRAAFTFASVLSVAGRTTTLCSCLRFWERVKQVLLIHGGGWLITPPGQRGSGCLEGEDSYNVKSEGTIVNLEFDWKSRKGSVVKIQDYQLYIQASSSWVSRLCFWSVGRGGVGSEAGGLRRKPTLEFAASVKPCLSCLESRGGKAAAPVLLEVFCTISEP